MSAPTRRPFWSLDSLRRRLFVALVAIGVVPLAILGLGGAAWERQVIGEQSARELTGLARGLAGQLDIYLDGLLDDSRAIAVLPRIVSMDPAEQDVLLKELFHQYPAFARLSTLDLAGRRLASSHPIKAPTIAERASFERAAERGQQSWEVAIAAGTGRPSLIIHTPIRNADRRVVEVVRSTVDLGNLAEVVGRVPVGGGGRAFVLDADGRVLLHPDRSVLLARPDYSWLGLSGAERPAGAGTVRYKLEGEGYVAGYAPVLNAGWTVVAAQPESEVLAPAEASWRRAVIGLVASALIAVLVAIVLARAIARPVRELAAAARAVAAGDPEVPLPQLAPNSGELGLLVRAFANMREAVRAREEALRRSATDNARLYREAQEAIRARDEFLSIASHELRTPVAIVRAAAQFFLRARDRGQLDEDRLARSMRTIDDATGRLTVLTSDLLDVSRIQMGRLPLELAPLDLAGLVHAVTGRYQYQLGEQPRIQVEAPASPTIVGDAGRIEQVLTNLLDNAIKYSPDGGEIRITLAEGTDDGVLLQVQDAGIGLPPGAGETIFQPFGRAANAAARHIPGLGLGLYICRSIVERHGGKIWADSDGDGCGTTFSLWLPIRGVAAEQEPVAIGDGASAADGDGAG